MFRYATIRKRTAQGIIAANSKDNLFASATAISRRWKSQPAVVSTSSLNEEENDEFPSSSPMGHATGTGSNTTSTATIPTPSTRTTDPRSNSSSVSKRAAFRFTAPSPAVEALPKSKLNTSSSSSSSPPPPPVKGIFVKLQSIFSHQKQDQEEKQQQKNLNKQSKFMQQHKKDASHERTNVKRSSLEQRQLNDDTATSISKQSTNFTVSTNNNKPSSSYSSSPQQMQRVDSVIKKYFQHQQEQRQQLQKNENDEDNYQLLFLQSSSDEPLNNSTHKHTSDNNNFSWKNAGSKNYGKNRSHTQSPSNSQQPLRPMSNNYTKNNKTEQVKNIELPKYASSISLGDLSELSRISIPKILQYLEKFGIASTSNATRTTSIHMEEAELLLLEIGGYHIVRKDESTEPIPISNPKMTLHQQPRPPVICMMGHVDHGKTTLMDALRAYSKLHESPPSLLRTKSSTTTDLSNVAGTEAGGITQMISAFQIPLSSSSNKATFLDTPGHAAFSQMRHCGLHATDILILVIAGDDGVKEQTLEIIRMISASNSQTKNNIQLVIAMTKIDKPSVHIPSAIERLENELLMHGIETEGVGGTVPIVPVSGITSEGLDTLMNQISNCSQNLICTPPEEEGMGIVLDARVERGVGVVAECVVRSGHFRTGGYVVADRQHGKIRRLHNVWNQPITVANPSDPIRLVGLDRLPNAGDTVLFVCNEKRAEELLSHRHNFLLYQDEETIPSNNSAAGNKRPDRAHDPIADLQITNNKSDLHRMKALKRYGLMDADGMEVTAAESADDETVRIPIIIKSDAHGTLHAVELALLGIATKSKHSLLIDPIRCAVGPINAADITLSLESDAPIFAFNVGKEKGVVAEDGVRIHQGNIIYRLIEDAKEEFAKFLPPLLVEHVQGSAKVQAVYDYDGKGGRKIIAGCRITDGILFLDKCESGQRVTYRVLRGGRTIISGLRAESLKKFKENVTQIRRGEECGLCLDNFDAINEGDVIECYITQEEENFM